MMKKFVVSCYFLFFALVPSTTSDNIFQDDEWEKYGCANPNANANPMAACFCGLLKDRKDSSESSAAELSASSAATCTGGSAGGFPCANVDLLSHIPLATFGSDEANDIWGWTDLASGREFALLGLSDGTAFVEITTPHQPIYLGKLPTHTSSSSWRDIKVYQDHAFIVSEASGHGMQVFDLMQLLSISSPPVTFSNTAYYNTDGGNVRNIHNIVINEDSGYAYLVGGTNGCSGGLHMVNISTPTSPSYAGCFDGDGYVHDAHCVNYNGPDTTYTGQEICFCCNTDTVTIVDVTDKANPVQLSRTPYANHGYTHQGWLSPDHGYFVFGDETDETSQGINTKTLVMDVHDLHIPFLAGSYLGPTRAIDHNLYIVNDIVYLANYRAGLRVLKINDLSTANLSEIGYFDVVPSSDSANYNGAWSVFPYFPSGRVVVSGIEQGLFVLSPDPNALPPTSVPSANPSESPSSAPVLPVCDNDGTCEPGENCNNCPNDCGSKLNGNPSSRYCCDGNNLDNNNCGNAACACASVSPTPPSGPPPSTPSPSGPPPVTLPPTTPPPTSCVGNKAPCNDNTDCCSLNCKGGSCKGNRRLGQAEDTGFAFT